MDDTSLQRCLDEMADGLDQGLVPARLLNDPEVHRLELDRVFGRSWTFLGHESEIALPGDYFPNNDPTRQPENRWRSHAHLLFGNWINELYQTTPFAVDKIGTTPALIGKNAA